MPLPEAKIGVPIEARPVDAGMHLGVAEDRMVAAAEAGASWLPSATGLRTRNFFALLPLSS